MASQRVDACLLCGPSDAGSVYDPDTDETVCRGCGTVIQMMWGADAHYQNTMSSDHYSTNTPTPRKELGGYMGGPGGPARDVDGRIVRDTGGIRRQQTWHHRTARRSGVPESVRRCQETITGLADRLALPAGARMDAMDIGARACVRGLTRGRSAIAVAAAAVLLASRKAGLARSMHDVEKASNVDNLGAHYRLLCTKLDERPQPPSPLLYVSKTASDLGLSAAVARAASEMLVRMQASGCTAGRNPIVLAAAAVYAASGKISPPGVTAEEAGRVTGVSSVSIRQGAKALASVVGNAPSGR